MHFATRFRLFFLGLLPLLAGFLASSCQSSRPSFSFQPAPYRATTAIAAGVSITDSTALPAAPAAAEAVVADPAPTPRSGAQRLGRLAARLPRLAAAPADPTGATTTLVQAQPRHLPRLLRQRATHGAAESGLGGIGLFAIGVVLALLAGLGALFALIPGVSFFGGVGLAVAALVVLFLLYGLASGGKKKA